MEYLLAERSETRGTNGTDEVEANVVISLSGTHLPTTFKT